MKSSHLISRFPSGIFHYPWMTTSQPTKLSVRSGNVAGERMLNGLFGSSGKKPMGHDATKGRWRERAEEMLSIAQTMQDPETKAHMERLAADWLWMAEQAEESRSKRDEAAVPPPPSWRSWFGEPNEALNAVGLSHAPRRLRDPLPTFAKHT